MHLRKMYRAIQDLLDGCTDPAEIHRFTGLPMSRCEELYRLYQQLPILSANEIAVEKLEAERVARWKAFKDNIAKNKKFQPEYFI
jgi:hypothetical protein